MADKVAKRTAWHREGTVLPDRWQTSSPIDLSRELRLLRLAAGLTQAELADMMGVNSRAYGYYERPYQKGHMGPWGVNIKTLEDAAKVLGLRLRIVFERMDLEENMPLEIQRIELAPARKRS